MVTGSPPRADHERPSVLLRMYLLYCERPAHPHPDVPRFEDGTHDGMIDSMIQAHENQPTSVLGHKGLTPLMLLQDFDLRRGNACDDLHVLYMSVLLST